VRVTLDQPGNFGLATGQPTRRSCSAPDPWQDMAPARLSKAEYLRFIDGRFCLQPVRAEGLGDSCT
jgi:hypothetical protein